MKKQLVPLFATLLLIIGLVSFVVSKPAGEAQAQTGSFSFGVAGDFASSSNTDKVLAAAKSSGVNFFFGVGDLSYNTKGSPAGWGTYVKNIIGTLPFVFVMGNHDASQVNQFIAALPNPISGVQGSYGKQYFFDYPTTSPIARFIFFNPVNGSNDVNWLNSSIDSGRAKGLKWIIVGLHHPCITTGVKSCESGSGMMNAMLSKKVDVVLYGHEHNYQRSKQLTCAKAGSFTASCVAAPGPTFKKDAGTVMLVVGTGGNSFYGTNAGDSEAGYYATRQSNTYGFMKFTVSPTQLKADFVRAAGGTFSDSFTIDNAATPSTAPVVPVVSTAPIVSAPVQQPVGVTPSFFPLAPCPTCSSPSVIPLSEVPIEPSSAASVPSGVVENPGGGDPCAVNNSITDNAKKSKSNQGAISKLMDQLLKLILELLNKLIELMGGQAIQSPLNENPGGGGNPGDPCAAQNAVEVPTGGQEAPAVTGTDKPKKGQSGTNYEEESEKDDDSTRTSN